MFCLKDTVLRAASSECKDAFFTFIFEQKEQNAVTVNREWHHNVFTDFFTSQVEGMDQVDIHLQQNKATCHTTTEKI